MAKNRQKIGWLWASLLFVTVLALANEPNPNISEGNYFRIRYESRITPLPLNQIHSWILHVETLDGKPVDNAMIVVSGGMPAHKHGLPTQPAVTGLGGGEYLVEGVKFTMTGLWEMEFLIQAVDASESLKFNIHF